jgi:FKBP-type peptidyl-prolyl cis-trans isomerase
MKILCLIILLLIQQILLAQANTLTGKNGIVQYTIYTSNDTAKIVDGCYFKIDYKQYYNDSLLVDSKQSMPQLVHVDSNVSIDFKQIFLQAKKGDSIITIQQVNDLPNKDALPLFLQSGGNLNTHYYIAAVYYDKASAEKEVTAIANQKLIADSIKNVKTIKAQSTIIDQYVTANKLNAIKKTSGLQIVKLKKGIEGLGLKINKKVSIKYTGKTLDGNVFDSNIDSTFEHTEPLQFTIGAGQVIKGLDEGLTYFNEGATGLIIIPSPLAYGENGSGEIIGKNQILIFEIEVLKSKIKPKPTSKKKK